MKDGSRVTVNYSNGFPDFKPWSKGELELPKDLWFASDARQFSHLNKKLHQEAQSNPEVRKRFSDADLERLADGENPKGFTWHHHQEAGKMHLVDSHVHSKAGHTGGRKIWGGGDEKR